MTTGLKSETLVVASDEDIDEEGLSEEGDAPSFPQKEDGQNDDDGFGIDYGSIEAPGEEEL
jgi:hypothetical protein